MSKNKKLVEAQRSWWWILCHGSIMEIHSLLRLVENNNCGGLECLVEIPHRLLYMQTSVSCFSTLQFINPWSLPISFARDSSKVFLLLQCNLTSMLCNCFMRQLLSILLTNTKYLLSFTFIWIIHIKFGY